MNFCRGVPMKKRTIIRFCCFLNLLLMSFILTGCDFFQEKTTKYGECVNINMAVIWNGLSSIYPSTGTDNPTAAVIREKTGVKLLFNRKVIRGIFLAVIGKGNYIGKGGYRKHNKITVQSFIFQNRVGDKARAVEGSVGFLHSGGDIEYLAFRLCGSRGIRIFF